MRRPNKRRKDGISKVGLEEERYQPADWIHMTGDGCRWLAVVLTLLNLSE